jgi:hypothetical protein
MSKLPFSLIATVRLLARDPTAVGDPNKELKGTPPAILRP